jgi:hypothetical protein
MLLVAVFTLALTDPVDMNVVDSVDDGAHDADIAKLAVVAKLLLIALFAQLEVPNNDPVIPLVTVREPVTCVLLFTDTTLPSSLMLLSFKCPIPVPLGILF